MTTRIEQLTAEINLLESRLPELGAEFDKLDGVVVDQQRRAAAGDTDAASQLTASRQRRAMINIEHGDITSALKVAKRELDAAKADAAKADAAECLPQLAELHASVPDLFAQLETGIAQVVAAHRALSAVENEAFSAVYAAGRVLGLGRDDLNFRRTLGRELPQAMLQAAMTDRPFDNEQPAARLRGAVWQVMRDLADETGAPMPEVAA